MKEEDISSNIEWEQKKGFSDKTRLSRRVNLQKSISAQAKDRNNFKATAKQLKSLPANLKKLKTKIKDIYDEDEEDEENEVIFNFTMEDENSSLISALKEDEKNKLQIKKTLENQKMQQTAGKMEAIMMAEKVSKQLGLKTLKRKIVNENIQDVLLSSETFEKTIKQNVTAKTKIKTESLAAKETTNMVKGLRKIKQASLTDELSKIDIIDNMDANDLVKIGKSADDQKTAEIILEKSGRKEKKKKTKKEYNNEVQKVKSAIKQVKTRD